MQEPVAAARAASGRNPFLCAGDPRDLWQRIDVVFYEGCGNEERGKISARLVFPEHYEEAVENTPARILFTQHHGSGNNYRQCFYNKEMTTGSMTVCFI